MESNAYNCKICEKPFAKERSLHGHLKAHKVTQAEYYCRYYPRYNKLTGDPLPFKNKFLELGDADESLLRIELSTEQTLGRQKRIRRIGEL